MPTWCDNVLKIKGPKDDILTFLKKASDAHLSLRPDAMNEREIATGAGWRGDQWFSFHAFVPIPDELIKSGEHRDWVMEHWDTKWDAEVARVAWGRIFKVTNVAFRTAWGPPESVIEAMRKQFPTLEIKCKWSDENGQRDVC